MNIDLKELKEHLAEVMQDKDSEAAMISVVDINCKIPQEIASFLIDFLKLETDEAEVLEEIYKLTPKQLLIIATLAIIANGRAADFIRLERNMIVLKNSLVFYIKDNPEYRKTSLDENEDNPEAALDALITLRKIIRNKSSKE